MRNLKILNEVFLPGMGLRILDNLINSKII